ncbi:hypothetical protein M2284_002633 [Rhodococcus sp. LBL1]|nr:hypothetical protein [Rhodococcus sp. LBL1]MDH6684017.1 hypothetical protein [Rhodococcus sp. LBL2]
MISDQDIETATMVYAACTAADIWFPKVREEVIKLWASIFASSGLSRDDLLAGVERAYLVEDSPFRPLPADIIKHARTAYSEVLGGLSQHERDEMNDASHILQDLGVSPPAAHRWVRAVKAGRRKPFELTLEQDQQFRRKVAERRQLQADPGRARAVRALIGGPSQPRSETKVQHPA